MVVKQTSHLQYIKKKTIKIRGVASFLHGGVPNVFACPLDTRGPEALFTRGYGNCFTRGVWKILNFVSSEMAFP